MKLKMWYLKEQKEGYGKILKPDNEMSCDHRYRQLIEKSITTRGGGGSHVNKFYCIKCLKIKSV